MTIGITSVVVREEQDIVYARQRARLIAELVGFERTDQTRISTAVSEIARNAYLYGHGGEVAFSVEGVADHQSLTVVVSDHGPGIADLGSVLDGSYASPTGMGLGIVGARRLMDTFLIESSPAEGTTVVLAKRLPADSPEVTPAVVGRCTRELAKAAPISPVQEVSRQNKELLETMEELRLRQDELIQVNAELEETNRGVMALYTELEDKAKELKLSNSELESFSYSISHDLRAPLRAIDGFSQMVIEDAAERLDADDVEHLRHVRTAAQRMAVLIDHLLGLSRASRQTMSLGEVDVSATAREVLAELREAQPERQVETVVAPGLRALADKVLLRAILTNLLSNAWKFTARHETARIEVGVTDSSGEPAFFVRDDGAGFDMRFAGHLFGAFQRMHEPEKFEGDGIGLATTHRLVSRHGGRIWAESEVEKGATFYFSLPQPKEP